jgi:hypothetical protein
LLQTLFDRTRRDGGLLFSIYSRRDGAYYLLRQNYEPIYLVMVRHPWPSIYPQERTEVLHFLKKISNKKQILQAHAHFIHALITQLTFN